MATEDIFTVYSVDQRIGDNSPLVSFRSEVDAEIYASTPERGYRRIVIRERETDKPNARIANSVGKRIDVLELTTEVRAEGNDTWDWSFTLWSGADDSAVVAGIPACRHELYSYNSGTRDRTGKCGFVRSRGTDHERVRREHPEHVRKAVAKWM